MEGPGHWAHLAARAAPTLVTDTTRALGSAVPLSAQRAAVEHLCATLLPAELQAVADVRHVAPYKLEDLAKAEGLKAFLSTLAAPVRTALATRTGAGEASPEALQEKLLQHGTRLMLLKLPADLLRAWVALSGGALTASRTEQAAALAAYIFAPPPPVTAPALGHHPTLDASELYCECRQPHGGRFMISCDSCEEWFHGECVGVREADVPNPDDFHWNCKACTRKGKARAPSGGADGGGVKRERADGEAVLLSVEGADGERIELRAHAAPAAAQRLQALLAGGATAALSVAATAPTLHVVARLAKSAPHADNNNNSHGSAAEH